MFVCVWMRGCILLINDANSAIGFCGAIEPLVLRHKSLLCIYVHLAAFVGRRAACQNTAC